MGVNKAIKYLKNTIPTVKNLWFCVKLIGKPSPISFNISIICIRVFEKNELNICYILKKKINKFIR